MKNEIKQPSMAKKIGALALVGVLGLGAGVGGMMLFAPEPVDVSALEANAFEAGVNSVVIPEPVVVNNTVVKEVEVIKEVDNEKLSTVLEYLQENFYLEDVFDVDEDELNLIVDNIVFENDVLSIAEELVKNDGLKYLDDETNFFGKTPLKDYRDNDVYKFSVLSDSTVVDVTNYEDKEATVFVTIRMKLDNDDDKLSQLVKFEVEIEDEEVEIINAELI